MKSILLTIALLMFVSCASETTEPLDPPTSEEQQMATVTTTLGFTYTESPLVTRALVPASATNLTRIVFQVFDNQGNAYGNPILQYKTDANFGTITTTLPIGTYTFVVVAHATSAQDVASATISSLSLATLPERPRGFVYSKAQQVTITPTTTTVNMDTCDPINAVLGLEIKDKVPMSQDIVKLQIIYNSQLTDEISTFGINPSTGLLTTDGKLTIEVPLTAGSTFSAPFVILLPAANHTAKVTLNALNSNDQVVMSKTATDVPFQQGYRTTLSGNLFSSDLNIGFTFNNDYLGTLASAF